MLVAIDLASFMICGCQNDLSSCHMSVRHELYPATLLLPTTPHLPCLYRACGIAKTNYLKCRYLSIFILYQDIMELIFQLHISKWPLIIMPIRMVFTKPAT